LTRRNRLISEQVNSIYSKWKLFLYNKLNSAEDPLKNVSPHSTEWALREPLLQGTHWILKNTRNVWSFYSKKLPILSNLWV